MGDYRENSIFQLLSSPIDGPVELKIEEKKGIILELTDNKLRAGCLITQVKVWPKKDGSWKYFLKLKCEEPKMEFFGTACRLLAENVYLVLKYTQLDMMKGKTDGGNPGKAKPSKAG